MSFRECLFEKMKILHSGFKELEFYEFCYALHNIDPAEGWENVVLLEKSQIENWIAQADFFSSIQLKPVEKNRITLDKTIIKLTQRIFVGLCSGDYELDWIKKLFYFDIRSFCFFVRTCYISAEIAARFGGKPRFSFEPKQKMLENRQDIGYREFAVANAEIDKAFISTIKKIVDTKGAPLLLTIVGPTASGKSEITSRLKCELEKEGRTCSTVEMDNFYKDREFRDGKSMDSRIIHYGLFMKAMSALRIGQKALMPKYDFILATSSHDLNEKIRDGQEMQEIDPADIILLEGNFPFYLREISALIDIKTLYFAEDPIRLLRKWRRDVDYRKKYEPAYLSNRYFRTQALRNQEIYQPMMMSCEIIADTSLANLWIHPQISDLLQSWNPDSGQ